jgi:hypothetical protein
MALVAAELCLRWMLFGPGAPSFSSRLRAPSLYADPWSDEVFWRLTQRFYGDPGTLSDERYHPLLGWRTRNFDAVTYEHSGAARLNGRRPVLLYGDSFAHGVTPRSDSFEGLMERSPLGANHQILNYGVHAYGLDQIYLLMRESIERWAALDPVVVIGIYVDDDLDRAVLRYRGWPKPRLVLGSAGLDLESQPVPSQEEYLDAHPDPAVSYLWRWFLYGNRWMPSGVRDALAGERARQLEKKNLAHEILRACKRELDGRGIEWFVLLFHGRRRLEDIGPSDWREETLLRILREERIPHVSSKPALQRHALANDRDFAWYFGTAGAARDHYLPAANEVVFGVLADGLKGGFSGRFNARLPRAEGFQLVGEDEATPLVRHFLGYSKNFPSPQDREVLLIRVRPDRPTAFFYDVDELTSFRAIAKLPKSARDAGCGRVGLSVHVGAQQVFGSALSPENPEVAIDVDLRGASRLTISADDGGDGIDCDLLYLASPQFR